METIKKAFTLKRSLLMILLILGSTFSAYLDRDITSMWLGFAIVRGALFCSVLIIMVHFTEVKQK